MDERLDIALGFDAKYAPHAGAAIASIVQTAPNARFRFILLHDGVGAELRAKVEACAPGAVFRWTEVTDAHLPAFADRGHFNRTILFRLGLPQLAPADCHRVLYFDADIIVRRDVRALWAMDFEDAAIAAAADQYVDSVKFARQWNLPADDARYFNSGVLLIDLDRVRAEKSFDTALDFVIRNDANLLFADQDALNYVFWRAWTPINAAWNVQRFMTQKEMVALTPERRWDGGAPAIVHFIGLEKPWLPNKWHPWAWIYWQASARTPFARDVARDNGMNLYQMLKLRLRWWLRQPQAGSAR
jgi:lipopolysaccharide biosynthesis glycosyltransferase